MYRSTVVLCALAAFACKGSPRAGDAGSSFWKAVPDDALLYLRSSFEDSKTVVREVESLGLSDIYQSMKEDPVPLFGFGLFLIEQDSWPGIDPSGPMVIAFGRLDLDDRFKRFEVGLMPDPPRMPRAMHNRLLISAENPGVLRIALEAYLAERTPAIADRERPAFSILAKEGFVQLDILIPFRGDPESAPALQKRVAELARHGSPLAIGDRAATEHFASAPGTLVGYGSAEGLRRLHVGMAIVKDDLDEMVKALGELRWFDPGSRELGELAVSVKKTEAGETEVDAVLSLTESGRTVFAASGPELQMPVIGGEAPTFDLVWAANLPAMVEAASTPAGMSDGSITTLDQLDAELGLASPMVYSVYATHPFSTGKALLELSGGFLPMGLQLPLGLQVRAWADGSPLPRGAATVVFPKGTNVDQVVGLSAAFTQGESQLSVDSLPLPNGVALRAAFGMSLAEAFPNDGIGPQAPGMRQSGREPPPELAATVPVDSKTLAAAVEGSRELTFNGDHVRFRSVTGSTPLPPASPRRAKGLAPTLSRPAAACAFKAVQSAFRYYSAAAAGDGDSSYGRWQEAWPQLQACTAEHKSLHTLDTQPAPRP